MNLTQEQKDAIEWFRNNPPKYYVWFYKFYKKYLIVLIYFLFFSSFLLGIFQNLIYSYDINVFNIIKVIFFVFLGIGLFAFSFYLYKHFYTKRYAKKIGLTLKEWNNITKGIDWSI